MARALSNRQFRESTGPVDQSPHDANRPLDPLPRAGRPAPQDWMSEFPQEPASPHEPAMWVEVPHAPIAPPPHTEFRPFSLAGWIRSHRSLARTGALALAVISAGLLGLAAWMQREQNQAPADITPSTTSEPLLSRPSVTPPPAPPTVFTSQATPPPATSQPSQPAAREGESPAVTTPAPARTAAARDRAKTPPARTIAPPARVTGAASGRAPASSPSSSTSAGRFVPPLPSAIPPPARPPAAQAPPPVTDASSSASSTVTTSRPPVDRAPLILSSPAREPAASPVPTPAPAPPPPSPEARETAAVETLLERYRLAFSTLNSGVSDFWPGVNSRALDKAFNELEQQRFEFNQCRVQLNGAQADATCTGTATFVPKVGNKTPRTQSRQWSFRLVRAGNRWIIDSVQSR